MHDIFSFVLATAVNLCIFFSERIKKYVLFFISSQMFKCQGLMITTDFIAVFLCSFNFLSFKTFIFVQKL